MRFPPVITVPAATALAVLLGLAVYQYHWIERNTVLERERLQLQFTDSLRGIARDFDREISMVVSSVLVMRRASGVSPQLQVLNSSSRLVKSICFAQSRGPDGLDLRVVWANSTTLSETIPWPTDWAGVKTTLLAELAGPRAAVIRWHAADSIPALVRFMPSSLPDRPDRAPQWRFLIVVFDSAYLRDQLFPLLMLRYLRDNSGESYHVQVRIASGNGAVLYDSAPQRSFAAAGANSIGLLSADAVGGAASDEVDSANPRPADGAWRLAVTRDSQQVSSWVEQSQRVDLAMSATSFAVLGGALFALFLSARRARKLAACQSEFVSGVSHELRTPLAALRSIADNLRDGVVGPSKTRRYGLLMAMQVERLAEMVEDVLDFTRAQHVVSTAGDRRTDAAVAIDDAIGAYSSTLEAQGVEVVVDVPSDLPAAGCSSPLLRRSLQNLIGNAIKYGADGRWMRIAARRGSASEIVISVEDRGCGVRWDEREKIFEPFFRGQDVRAGRVAGVGLGLSLVKRSVESIGGRIAVGSALGRGAKFELILPIAEDHEATNPDC